MDIHHELITPNLRTTSRVVAEKFGKRHDNVLRDTQKVIEEAPEEFSLLNFEERDYLDSRGKQQPQIEMTRDGFVLLAMGFTGTAAMAWKVRFIEAFNLMEAELTARAQEAEVVIEPEPGPAMFDGMSHRTYALHIQTVDLIRKIRGNAAADAVLSSLLPMLDMPNLRRRAGIAAVLAGQ